MISRLNHVNVFVLDQDRAKAFYTETLGFELPAPADKRILDGGDAQARAGLLALRLLEWKAISSS